MITTIVKMGKDYYKILGVSKTAKDVCQWRWCYSWLYTSQIIFKIIDKPHQNFKRDGANITYIQTVSLKDALCGTSFDVPTLDGKTVRVDCSRDILKPNQSRRLQGYGLPFPKTPERRGDIILEFNVIFPETLSDSSRNMIRTALTQR